MESAVYQQRWHKLRESKADPDAWRRLSRQIAFACMDRYLQCGLYEPAYVELLCEMATFHAQGDLDPIACSALFGLVVEALNDDFDTSPIELHHHILCQVISYCRALPAGRALNDALADFGLVSFDHLRQRAHAICTRQYRYDPNRAPAHIAILSRVGLGADVAILSVMIQRLHTLFPQADIVIVGSPKQHRLFEGHPKVRLRELNYARREGLFGRFAAWHATLAFLRQESPSTEGDDLLVIDPDSRLSQFGVLPLLAGDNYLFFHTRGSAAGRCLAEQTNDWMDTVFGISDFRAPRIWPLPAVMQTARTRLDLLRAAGARRVLTVDFSVGKTPRKRVNLEFEKRLLAALASLPATVVVLDHGFGADEAERSAVLVRHVRECGLACLETRFDTRNFPALSHGVLRVACAIDEMAALIAHSDEYIGYDSAGPHIAAAAQTPTLTIFAGSNSAKFVRRWSASGDTECKIVHVDTLTNPQHLDIDEIVARVMQERVDRVLRSPQQRIHEIRKEHRRNHRPAAKPMKE